MVYNKKDGDPLDFLEEYIDKLGYRTLDALMKNDPSLYNELKSLGYLEDANLVISSYWRDFGSFSSLGGNDTSKKPSMLEGGSALNKRVLRDKEKSNGKVRNICIEDYLAEQEQKRDFGKKYLTDSERDLFEKLMGEGSHATKKPIPK